MAEFGENYISNLPMRYLCLYLRSEDAENTL